MFDSDHVLFISLINMNPTFKQGCSGKVSRSCTTSNRDGYQYAKINTNEIKKKINNVSTYKIILYDTI
jgi:hypothetical protein